MNSKFYVGAKVVCVDDSNQRNWSFKAMDDVVKGQTYVIREIIDTKEKFRDPFGANFGVKLVGVIGGVYPSTGEEVQFSAGRFRPLEELQQESRERYEQLQRIERRELV